MTFLVFYRLLGQTGCPPSVRVRHTLSTSSLTSWPIKDATLRDCRSPNAAPCFSRRFKEETALRSLWTTELQELAHFVNEHNLEGIVAKRVDSLYEPGRRSGAWVKMRLNKRQEFVIGGYTPSYLGLDALLVGFYRGKELRFAGSVRAGFNPLSRREVHDQIKHLETADCPFVNLPDRRAGAWGQGITAEKMKHCRWLKPTMVAEIEFAEWTPEDRPRHASFVGLRHDKNVLKVLRET